MQGRTNDGMRKAYNWLLPVTGAYIIGLGVDMLMETAAGNAGISGPAAGALSAVLIAGGVGVCMYGIRLLRKRTGDRRCDRHEEVNRE